MNYLSIALSAIILENFVFSRYLGICPFLGVSKNVKTAVGMGMSVTFTMTISTALTWLVNHFVLVNLNLEYLRTIVFILVIASVVQLIELFLKKTIPALYKSLGIYLPLITTNCAVLAASLIGVQNKYNFLEAVVFSFCAALGFMLAIFIFSVVRERIALCNIPKSFEGFPIAMVAAALVIMAVMGFTSLKLPL